MEAVPQLPTPTDRIRSRRWAIGRQIREARLAANLTQEQVCERIEMGVASYSRIEQGHASPLLDTLIRVADAIGVPLAHLVRD